MKTKRLHVAGLSFALLLFALFVASAQAGSAKPEASKVKQTAKPIWTLAMDGPRVAYASGGRIYVWNVVTGATSVVKGTYSNANHTDNAAEIAIAGKRVAWIKRQELGNTEQPQRLYSAPVGGGSAHRLLRVLGYRDLACGPGGSQIGGLVGSGSLLAVSTWQWSTGGSVPVPTHQRLNLITPTGLRAIATNAGAIVSASADSGQIAVVALPTQTWEPEAYCSSTPPSSVGVHSADGTLLRQVATGPVAEVALSGNLLVVLSATSSPTFAVHEWTTGALLHTWPVTRSPFDFAVAGQLAVYSVYPRRQSDRPNLHLLDLATGKDVVIASTTNLRYRDLAIDRRGLVYAVNPPFKFKDTRPGKLVFVPTAKLLAALSK